MPYSSAIRAIRVLFGCLLCYVPLNAQVIFSSFSTSYTQNFNTLRSTSGTSSTLPTGWKILETGSGVNSSYTANNGSSATGDTYSYGTSNNTDRALGALLSNSINSTIGVQIKNNSGTAAGGIQINYTGEFWRCGTANRTDRLDFQYSLNASSLSTGTWTDFNLLDFQAPASATTGAKDGNLAANRQLLAAAISGISIPNGGTLWLRWTDFNASGSDDGLAIDDVTLKLLNADNTAPAVISTNPVTGSTNLNINPTIILTFSESVVKGPGNLLIKKYSDGSLLQTIPATSASISVTGSTVSIALSALPYATNCYAELSAGFVNDLAGNPVQPITGSAWLSFTTVNPPPASWNTSSNRLDFGYVQAGTASISQSLTITAANLYNPLQFAASDAFSFSKDNISFSNPISLSTAELTNPVNLFVRFTAAVPNQNYELLLSITDGITTTTPVTLTGNSQTPVSTDTLKVVNWNIEWFGGSLGPADDNLQEQNVLTVMKNINADLYALAEVVSVPRLQNIVANMPGYNFIVSDFCSNGSTVSSCASAQKLAFVYRTSKINKLREYGVLRTGGSPNAYYNWSSGRFPFLMEADVTLNNATQPFEFIVLHAKANTADYVTSYNRRMAGAAELLDTLNIQYPASNILVMGDFNDDLDKTITTKVAPDTTTSWISFKNAVSTFRLPTLPLSWAGLKSTVSYNDIIDHVIYSNEVDDKYIAGSAKILRQEVESWIPAYGTTTTDHYPILSCYTWNGTAARIARSRPVQKPNSIQEISSKIQIAGTRNRLQLSYNATIAGITSVQLFDLQGRLLHTSTHSSINGHNSIAIQPGLQESGIIVVRVQSATQKWQQAVFIQ